MYDHIFHKQVQISRSDIWPHIKWAVSLVILQMVTSIFLLGLCGYIWVSILTFITPEGHSDLDHDLINPQINPHLYFDMTYPPAKFEVD